MVWTPDFNRFAPFYDPEYDTYTADLPLYLNYARLLGDPILEIGCGTGRVLVPLAQEGFRVVGVDIAPAMLARARARVQAAGVADRVRLIQADARALGLHFAFPFAFMAANTFLHHTTFDEQVHVLRVLRDHLRPGGRVVLDVFNPDLRMLLEADGRVELVNAWEEAETGATVLKFQRTVASPTDQRLDILYIYDRCYPDGRVERTVAPLRLRYLWPQEARLLVAQAGLVLEALYGSYDLDPVDDDSERLIIVARRP